MSDLNHKIIVFISYSWDSEPHKNWVANLASLLVNAGFEVRLDEWDTDLGDDLTLYMEASVRDAHRVLLICTEPYVRKANNGMGGVGYERMIVTGELARNLGTKKFIPVIRHGSGDELTPSFLAVRRYVDFRDDKEFDEKFKELIKSLNRTAVSTKPVIPSEPIATSDKPLIGSQDSVYEKATKIIAIEDMIAWRKTAQKEMRNFKKNIIIWRNKQDISPPDTLEALHGCADQMVEIASPLITMALAGVESGNQKFSNQGALLDEFINPLEWPRSGRVALIEMPEALGYIYHCLHGSTALSAGQASLAIKLATERINLNGSSELVFDSTKVSAWSKALGGNCLTSWKYIFSAFKRWKLLEDVCGDENEYQVALVAYFMVLSFIEYLDMLRNNKKCEPGRTRLSVPPCFLDSPTAVTERAIRLAAKAATEFSGLASTWNISKNDAVARWPEWITIINKWGNPLDRGGWIRANPMELFVDEIGWAFPRPITTPIKSYSQE